MGKYLAIFKGAASDDERESITADDSSDFLARWGAWASARGKALVDPGAPLYRKVRVTAAATAPFEDFKGRLRNRRRGIPRSGS